MSPWQRKILAFGLSSLFVLFFGLLVNLWSVAPPSNRRIASLEPSRNFENSFRMRQPSHPTPFRDSKVRIAPEAVVNFLAPARGRSRANLRDKIPQGMRLSVVSDRECVAKNGASRLTEVRGRTEHGLNIEAHSFTVQRDTDIRAIAEEAERDPCVLGISHEGQVTKNQTYGGPLISEQHHLNAIQAPMAANFFFHSSLTPPARIVIAIVDTGIEYIHADLASAMWTSSAGYHGYDFVNGDSEPIDDDGHGTHVAGIVAANGSNSQGGSGIMPVNAALMAVKVLDGTGSGSFSDVANGIRWAVDNGAQVVNLSISANSQGESAVIEDALVYAINHGVVVITAAGNMGLSLDNKFYAPGSYGSRYAGVLCVGAIDAINHRHVSYSNYGVNVEIAAPGSDSANSDSGILSTYLAGSYAYLEGTSMAAPVVSGATAMAIASLRAMNIPYTAGEIESLMLNSATVNPNLNGYVKAQAELNLPRMAQILSSDYLLTLEGGIRESVE